MILYLTAKTNIPDVSIDFIEVQLKNGGTVSLNWEESDISRSDAGFNARYKGVYFGEEYANGRLADLECLEITDIGLYYESEGPFRFEIDEIRFADGDEELTFTSPSIPRDCSGMDGIVFMDDTVASVTLVELQINAYDEHDNVSRERVFAVPKSWLMESFDFLSESALTDFLNEYTSDDSQEIYDAALLDHKIIYECDASQLDTVKRNYLRNVVIPALMKDGITLEQIGEELTYRDDANVTDPHAGWDDDLIDYSTEELELVEELWNEVAARLGSEKSSLSSQIESAFSRAAHAEKLSLFEQMQSANGIAAADEAENVLQALGSVLLNAELFPEGNVKNQMKAINIEWDVDCEEDLASLPTAIDIPLGMEDEEDISDYLTDVTGFCHKGFNLITGESKEEANPSFADQIRAASHAAESKPSLVEPDVNDATHKKSAAKSLPIGWEWVDWNDGSGRLRSPEGKVYFSYDLTPYRNSGSIEYREDKDSPWSVFEGSVSAFKEHAESIVSSRVLAKKDGLDQKIQAASTRATESHFLGEVPVKEVLSER